MTDPKTPPTREESDAATEALVDAEGGGGNAISDAVVRGLRDFANHLETERDEWELRVLECQLPRPGSLSNASPNSEPS